MLVDNAEFAERLIPATVGNRCPAVSCSGRMATADCLSDRGPQPAEVAVHVLDCLALVCRFLVRRIPYSLCHFWVPFPLLDNLTKRDSKLAGLFP